MTTTTHGGARQKVRPDDKRGGARVGAGALQKRINLTPVSARQLKRMAGWAGVSVEDYVIGLIVTDYQRWLEANEENE